MPTENRSSNTEMVSVPRDLAERIAQICMFTMYKEDYRAISEILAKQAHHHQGEPVAWLDPAAGLSWLVDRTTVAPGTKLYTHADPGDASKWRNEAHRFNLEVERLRTELTRMHEANWKASQFGIKLQAKLAEQDALLRDFLEVATGGFSDSDHVLRVRRHLETFLAASAEPEAAS